MAVPQSKSSIMKRVKNKLSDISGSEATSGADQIRPSDLSSGEAAVASASKVNSLNLRMVECKGDLVAPKL